jgi:mono/diheme cytochrome c family protein
MREQLARWIAALTAIVSVALALAFAWIHNPPVDPQDKTDAVAPQRPLSPSAESGRAVYEAQRCSMCHSIDGAGSPRYPLDGVGARHDETALRAWIVGAASVVDQLPDHVLRRKQQYQTLNEQDLDALVAYMHALQP